MVTNLRSSQEWCCDSAAPLHDGVARQRQEDDSSAMSADRDRLQARSGFLLDQTSSYTTLCCMRLQRSRRSINVCWICSKVCVMLESQSMIVAQSSTDVRLSVCCESPISVSASGRSPGLAKLPKGPL